MKQITKKFTLPDVHVLIKLNDTTGMVVDYGSTNTAVPTQILDFFFFERERDGTFSWRFDHRQLKDIKEFLSKCRNVITFSFNWENYNGMPLSDDEYWRMRRELSMAMSDLPSSSTVYEEYSPGSTVVTRRMNLRDFGKSVLDRVLSEFSKLF